MWRMQPAQGDLCRRQAASCTASAARAIGAARACAPGREVQQMEADHTPNFSAVPELVERLLAVR
jgi:hypothetical protein